MNSKFFARPTYGTKLELKQNRCSKLNMLTWLTEQYQIEPPAYDKMTQADYLLESTQNKQ